MPMKVADSVMMCGVLDGVFIAPTPYQIQPSYGANSLEVRFSFVFMSPDPVSSSHWVKTGREESWKMVQELADSPQDMASFKEWKAFFRRVPKGQDGHDVHHLVEKWIQKLLGIPGDLDEVPGIVMPGAGVYGHKQLAGKLNTAVKAVKGPFADELARKAAIIRAIQDVYTSNDEWRKLWPATQKWLNIKLNLPS